MLQKETEESFSKLGFEKFICSSPTSLKYALYRENAKNAVLNQIKECDDDNMIASDGNEISFSHPLKAGIGTHACKYIEHGIKSSEDPSVLWRTKQSDAISSTVGCL